MNSESAKQRFQEANRLFKNRQYEKALELLQQLNREFPNTENIMYAAALSLEKLGSIDEAKYLCHSMIRNFESVRAQELLNHLEVAPRVTYHSFCKLIGQTGSSFGSLLVNTKKRPMSLTKRRANDDQ